MSLNVLQELEAISLRVHDMIVQLNGGSNLGIIDGVTFEQYMAAPDRQTRWPGLGGKFMIAQYLKQALPHAYVRWEQGVPIWETGTNQNWIGKYEQMGWKGMYQNAEQEGAMPWVVNLIAEGEAAFVNAFTVMYYSPWGQNWLANPLTVGMRPKTPPVKG